MCIQNLVYFLIFVINIMIVMVYINEYCNIIVNKRAVSVSIGHKVLPRTVFLVCTKISLTAP